MCKYFKNFAANILIHFMKKVFLSFACLLFLLATLTSFTTRTAPAQQKKYALYGVAFYNLENLFDTLHDAGKNDYEYLPDGTMKWGKMKYEAKLHNLAQVISQLCTDKIPAGPAVIGVAEVENENALRDLLAQPSLAAKGYQYVDYPSYDRRGIECALIYNPRFFQLESSMMVPFYYSTSGQIDDPLLGFTTDSQGRVTACQEMKGDTTYITRGFLVAQGKLAGENAAFIVNHWPSRAAGDETRQRAAWQVRQLCNALQAQTPGLKIIVMGDMNDDPANKSMTVQLGCKSDIKDVEGEADFYNPWYHTLYKIGQGTLLYDGKWNLFDQIVLSGGYTGNDRTTLKYYKHEIFMRDWLFQQEGRYKGNPLRTHAGGVWLNGYSDHLPTQVYLIKEVK